MPSIEMKRTFHPVGQGAFYTEVFDCPNGDQKVNVYDCGTLTGKDAFIAAGGASLKDQITDFANNLKPGNHQIDYLFISHFHADHINGLPDLIQLLTPRCVVIPMLPIDVILTTRISNLISYGPDALPSDELIQDLFLGNDNREVIHRFEKIVAVWSDIPNEEQGSLYPKDAPLLGGSIKLLDDNKDAFWLYRLFNSVDLQDNRAKSFIKEVRSIPVLNGNTLNVQMVFNHIDDLKALYEKVMNNTDHNLYTLVVESEPLRAATAQGDESLAGCVFFGDFVPLDNVWGRFHNVINDYERKVGVIQVPHHGANTSWRSELLAGGAKALTHCVISAGSNNKFHHPYYWIIDEIMRSGRTPHVVSEYPASEFSLVYLI